MRPLAERAARCEKWGFVCQCRRCVAEAYPNPIPSHPILSYYTLSFHALPYPFLFEFNPILSYGTVPLCCVVLWCIVLHRTVLHLYRTAKYRIAFC